MPTKSDVEAADASVEQLDARQQEATAKLNGAKFDTQEQAETAVLADWYDYAVSKFQLKIEGGYTKIQIGADYSKVYGLKGEAVTPSVYGVILGAEIKTIEGGAQARIDGAKFDTIGGAKIDLLAGCKMERKAAKTNKFGAATALRSEAICNDRMQKRQAKWGTYATKKINELFKTDELKEVQASYSEDVAALKELVKEVTASAAKYKANVGKFAEDCSGATNVEAGTIDMKGDGGVQFWGNNGASGVNMFPSSQCILEGGGSKVVCGPSDVWVTGGMIKFGVSF